MLSLVKPESLKQSYTKKRAFTGKPHVSTVEHHRKNGDVYIYRRTTQ